MYPLSKKTGKVNFRKSADECFDSLTKREVRLFARRQRRYILAYLGIEKAKDPGMVVLNIGDDEQNLQLPDGIHLPEMSCQLVERLVKVFKQPHKCHRNIYDQDWRFIDTVVGWMKRVSK